MHMYISIYWSFGPQACFLVEEGSFKVKEQFQFSMMQSIIVSNLTDGLMLIRLPVDGETSKVCTNWCN